MQPFFEENFPVGKILENLKNMGRGRIELPTPRFLVFNPAKEIGKEPWFFTLQPCALPLSYLNGLCFAFLGSIKIPMVESETFPN